MFSQIKDTKHIRRDFYSVALVMPQGWDFGALGYRGGQFFFFKHGHIAYQIDGMTSRTKCKCHFHPRVKLVTLGARSKSQISLICQFQRFLYQTLCVYSKMKDRKHIEQNFHSVAKVKTGAGLMGAGGVKNFSVGICDCAPSTAQALVSSVFIRYEVVEVMPLRTRSQPFICSKFT